MGKPTSPCCRIRTSQIPDCTSAFDDNKDYERSDTSALKVEPKRIKILNRNDNTF